MADELYAFLARISKRCPARGESQPSSDNSTPLNHRCIACGWHGTDLEVLHPLVGGWTAEHTRARTFHLCRAAQDFAQTFKQANPAELEAELAKLHADCPKRLVVRSVGVVYVCNCPCHAETAKTAKAGQQ
jgi:hypothetical protein